MVVVVEVVWWWIRLHCVLWREHGLNGLSFSHHPGVILKPCVINLLITVNQVDKNAVLVGKQTEVLLKLKEFIEACVISRLWNGNHDPRASFWPAKSHQRLSCRGLGKHNYILDKQLNFKGIASGHFLGESINTGFTDAGFP